jgi:hypothetical protein
MRWVWASPFVHGSDTGGAGGSGGSGAGGGASPPGASPGASAGGEGGGGAAPSFLLPAEARPEWLPETFYDAPGKAIRVDALAKSYGELHGKLGQRAEVMREQLLAELRQGVPAKPEDYKVTVPTQGLPEGFQPIDPPETDPMLAAMRTVAHEAGLKPAQFQKMTDAFYAWQASQMIDTTGEIKKIGDGAEARIGSVKAFLDKTLGADAQGLMLMTMTAPSFLALEKLVGQLQRGGTMPAGAPPAGGDGVISAEQAREHMAQPAYRQPGVEGDRLRAQVEAFFKAGGKIPRT